MRSNGWGSISVPGGGTSFQGTPIFYIAAYQQQGIGAVPTIHSEFRSKNIEVNDTINWKNWTWNVGFLDSLDTLYGQGLNNASGTLSGFVLATGTTSDGLYSFTVSQSGNAVTLSNFASVPEPTGLAALGVLAIASRRRCCW